VPASRHPGFRTLITIVIGALLLAGCSVGDDGKIRLTVATFGEFGYESLYKMYEADHPNIKIVQRVTKTEDHHKNLAAHLATNIGAADIEAVEEGWIGQFTSAPNRFVDLSQYGAASIKSRWPDWKWKAGTAATGQVIGLGTDVGGMAMCYRRDLFAQAGLPTERDEVAKLWPTWEKYIEVGQAFKSQMPPNVAFADGETALYRSALGQSKVGIYDSPDHVAVATNPAVKRAWSLSVQVTQLGLTAKAPAFSQDWTAGLSRGAFATLACPSWMMAFIQEQASKFAGVWDITTVPGGGGNWGGSWITVPKQTKHPAEAAALAMWLTAPEQQAAVFRAVGNFPSTLSLYQSPEIRDFKNPFFHDAPVGQIYSRSVTTLVPQYMGPRSGDINTRIINGLTRVEQGRDTPDESWHKVLDEVDALS
jgi:cellobiose transport system substrate-binding protein